MKFTLSLLITAFAITCARADIVIEQELVNPTGTSTMTSKIKGDKMRIDTGADSSTIMNTTTMDMVTLMHTQKSAMKISGEKMKALQAAQAKDPTTPQPKPVNTGKTDKVDGYDCTLWTMNVAGAEMTFWVAKNFPDYDALKKELEAITKSSGVDPTAMDMGGMVVKTEVKSAGINITTRVTSVKKATVADSEFEVPAGYKEIAMP